LAEFSNPNQQGGQDNKSLLTMMAVLLVVFFGLQLYRAKTNPQTVSPSGAPPAAAGAPPAATSPAAAAASAQTKTSSSAAPAPVTPTAPVVQASAESITTVENELYRIQFSNRGGQVTSWILKRFKDSDGKKPLDLVHGQAAQEAIPSRSIPMSRR
jgi:YidC/Oxa1 family membrane protein insertase